MHHAIKERVPIGEPIWRIFGMFLAEEEQGLTGIDWTKQGFGCQNSCVAVFRPDSAQCGCGLVSPRR